MCPLCFKSFIYKACTEINGSACSGIRDCRWSVVFDDIDFRLERTLLNLNLSSIVRVCVCGWCSKPGTGVFTSVWMVLYIRHRCVYLFVDGVQHQGQVFLCVDGVQHQGQVCFTVCGWCSAPRTGVFTCVWMVFSTKDRCFCVWMVFRTRDRCVYLLVDGV